MIGHSACGMNTPQRSRTSEEPLRLELEEWNALALETQDPVSPTSLCSLLTSFLLSKAKTRVTGMVE